MLKKVETINYVPAFFCLSVILLGIIIVAKKVIIVLIDIDFQLNNFKIQNTSKHLTFT